MGGDWRFFWQDNISALAHAPSAWDPVLNSGFGTSGLSIMWLDSYLQLTASLSILLHIPWFWISLIFWILPPIIIAFLSAFFLFKNIFPLQKNYAFLSGIIYASNTYFLLVFSGGQLGVSFAYALIPFIFYGFYCSFKNLSLQNSLICGLFLAILMLFDPRFVILFLGILTLYWLFVSFEKRVFGRQIFYIFIIPLGIVFLLHLFWILPLLLAPKNVLPQNFTSTNEFIFFSFTDFSHSLALLHPNWPDNMFGKVSFMKGEFLLLPIIAFSSLFFLSKKKSLLPVSNRFILFFVLLGLLGSFLAKGANEPFKQLNIFLFDYFPAMSLFRDATKFYLFVALSYAILIPIALFSFATILQRRFKQFSSVHVVISLTFILLWFALLIGSSQGKVISKFYPKVVPQEYQQLRDTIAADTDFARTLWIPSVQRYAYSSTNHPAMGIKELEKVVDKDIQKKLTSTESARIFKNMSIRYVIVPFDSEKEFFTKNNEYNTDGRDKIVNQLKKVSWLKQNSNFHQISLFTVANTKDHFWSSNKNAKITYEQSSPTYYTVSVKNARKDDRIVFSEQYDPQWHFVAQATNEKLSNMRYEHIFNSIVIPDNGDYILTVSYKTQEFVGIGLFLSGSSLVTLLGALIYLRRRR